MALNFDFDFDDKIAQLAKVPKLIRIVVVLAVLAAVNAGYYFLSYQKQDVTVGKLYAKAQKLQRQLNQVRAVTNNIDDFEQEVADLERELDKALTQLPDSKQFEDLLQDITTAGKKVGVQIKSIQRGNEVRHGFYAEVPFMLELEGNYHEVAMFFERVARLPRIVNIGTLNLGISKENRHQTTLKVTGRATTFRFLSLENDHAAVAPGNRKRGSA